LSEEDPPEIVSISGSPTGEQEAAIREILSAIFDEEARTSKPSAWKYAGRTSALSARISEGRHRLGINPWRSSAGSD
jgi:hypothetical protein